MGGAKEALSATATGARDARGLCVWARPARGARRDVSAGIFHVALRSRARPAAKSVKLS
jgi:hypothetical protein